MKIGDGQPKSYNTSTRVVAEVNKQLWWLLNQARWREERKQLQEITEEGMNYLEISTGF